MCFVIGTFVLGGPRREVISGLGTRSGLYSAWSGSGDWIRTSDLVVTLIHYFHNGVDYIIILRMRMQGAI